MLISIRSELQSHTMVTEKKNSFQQAEKYIKTRSRNQIKMAQRCTMHNSFLLIVNIFCSRDAV